MRDILNDFAVDFFDKITINDNEPDYDEDELDDLIEEYLEIIKTKLIG